MSIRSPRRAASAAPVTGRPTPRRRPAAILASAIGLSLLAGPIAAGRLQAQSMPAADATPAPLVLPEAPPDAAAGLEIYRERCASCHGPVGRGDGEMRDQLPGPPVSFADPAYARQALPAAAFDVVSNGRLEKLMPPWSEALSPQERWDVIFGAWSFYATPERLVRGKVAWETRCAACHGAEPGAGAAESPLPLADSAWWMERSLASLHAGLRDTAAAGQAHAELSALPDEALWASLDYARTALYQPLPFDALSVDGRIEGRVVNGTAGIDAVAGSRVLAIPVDPGTREILPTDPISTVVGADGRFAFTGLLAGPDVAYSLVASYEGAEYFGDELLALSADPDGQPRAEAELEVFAADEATPLRARLAQIVVAVQPEDGFVSVAEAWAIGNDSDRVRIGETVLRFELPPDAAGLRFDDARYQSEARLEQGVLTSPVPFPPGERVVSFSYGLPHEGSRLELSRRLDLPVERMHLIAVGEGLTIESPQLSELRVEERGGDVVTDAMGEDLTEGTELRAMIGGLPEPLRGAAAATLPLAEMPFSQPQLGLVALVLGLIGALALAIYPRLSVGDAAASAGAAERSERRMLIERIAELDRALADGRLDPERHARRRAALVDRALALARRAHSQEESR